MTDRVVIALLMPTTIASGFFGAAGYDTVRDVAHAEALHRFATFPLHGPELAPGQADGLHLGPVWYYLLALPLWLHSSWLAIAVFVATLTSLQYPLAYATGKRLGGRRLGLLWCVLLALPGWGSFELVGFAHTNAVRVAVLLTFYALARASLESRPRWLCLAAFALALAVHAHPTALAYAPLALVVGYSSLPDASARLRWGLGALLVAALPFAPLAIEALTTSSSLARNAGSYAGGSIHLANLLQVPALLYGVLVRGPWVVANAFCDFGAGSVGIVFGTTLLIEAFAAAGVVIALIRSSRLAVIAIGVVVLATLVIALLRPVTPFYMTYALLPALAAAGAVGLDALGAGTTGRDAVARPTRGRRWTANAAIGGTLALHVMTAAGIAVAIVSGHVSVPVASRMDVKAEAVPPASAETWLPAYAVDRSGNLLCGSAPAVLHGTYAFLADVYGGLDQQLGCRRHDAQLLGAGPTAAAHWIGLAAPLWQAVGVKPRKSLGGLGIAPATRVLWPDNGTPIRDARVYPPRPLRTGPARRVTIDAQIPASEALVVSTPFAPWMPPPRIDVSVNGAPLPPVAQDTIGAVYRCSHCPGTTSQRWTIVIDSAAPDWIDVTTIAAPAEIGAPG